MSWTCMNMHMQNKFANCKILFQPGADTEEACSLEKGCRYVSGD